MTEKLSEEDIKIMNETINENEQWLQENEHSTEELTSRKNDFNVLVQPYMSKLYPGQDLNPGVDSVFPDSGSPVVDEVD